MRATANSLFVSGDGTAGIASRAFNTTLSKWAVNGDTLYANSTAAQVPSSLNGVVLSVIGLDDAVGMHGDATIGIPNYLVSSTVKASGPRTTPARRRRAPTRRSRSSARAT